MRVLTPPPRVVLVTGAENDPYDDAEKVLRLALCDDPEAVAGTFDAVVSRSGMGGAYDVAVCLVATMVGLRVPSGTCWLEFVRKQDAVYFTRLWLLLISAYLNSDTRIGKVLFEARMVVGMLRACQV